jgi:hypothetical protein
MKQALKFFIGAWAALVIGAPSSYAGPIVTTSEIQDGTIQAVDLGANSVTQNKIADGAVSSSKLAMAVYTKAEVDALIYDLQAQIAALQSLLQHFSRAGNEVTLTGANLRIVNGASATESANGLGNLIVGYNEERGNGTDARDGSHNIIVGQRNNYRSWGGIVASENAEISGKFCAVISGTGGVASGIYSGVFGGQGGLASGTDSQVIGGYWNVASYLEAIAIGGDSLHATGWRSTAVGGLSNTASGDYTTVVGGVGQSQ